ncbi:MAG: SEL1-like repeat protein [Candidatus Izemoplasmatales bacterium]
MNQKLNDEINEVVRLITIEKRLGKTSIAKEDATFVRNLADKKRYPRAEYVLARMYLCGYQVEQDKALGLKYLSRSSRHASYSLQLKIAYIYHLLGDFYLITKCLKRAIDDCTWHKPPNSTLRKSHRKNDN